MENLSLLNKETGVVYRYKIYLITVDRFLTYIKLFSGTTKMKKKKQKKTTNNMSLVAKCWNDIKLQVFHYFLPII